MHVEAAQVLSDRARLSPQNPMVWNDLGVEYVAARQTKEAHDAFTRALRVVADYTPSLYNLGRLAIDHCAAEKAQERPSEDRARACATEAIRYFEATLFKDPLDHRMHAALSAAYTHIGDTVRAHFHLSEASKLKPVEIPQSKATLLKQLFSKVLEKPQPQAVLPFLFSTGEEFQTR